MKTLCTCAALAVATAIAHGSFADATAQGKNKVEPFRATVSDLTKISDNLHCTAEINAWRKKVDPDATEYQPHTTGVATTDLQGFFSSKDCSVFKDGTYTHIHENSGAYTFVFSATKDDASRAELTCAEAVELWKTGFSAFEGQYPAKFQENTGAYDNLNAVGLVGMLMEGQPKIFCGNPTGCDPGSLVCYIKPSPVTAGQHPVGAELWHKVEESYNLKPKLTAHEDDQGCVDAVNAVRGADRLNLPQFTVSSAGKRLRLKKARSLSTSYKDALYNLTCEAVNGSTIDPKIETEYTLIYAVKDGGVPPTAEEAVEFWKSGYDELGPDVPPAFKVRGLRRAEGNEGEIYYNSAVAGFVSLMTDEAREMLCYTATGCEKSALICFLSKPTLVENEKPISDKTWQKIVTLESEENHDKNMQFTKLTETNNCLTEINEFRTQDSLGLKAFVAKASGSTDSGAAAAATRDTSDLEVFTCASLKNGTAPILFPSTKRSVMYYSGSTTCSDAVTEWKKGYDKFKDLTVPPKYTSSETMYSTGAATNFISLVSEGEETVVRCYSVEGCSEPGLVCVMEPAVFEEGKSPITEATWQKVTSTLSNGVSGASVYGALLSSVLVAFGLFALNF